jgi:hypothetical protein
MKNYTAPAAITILFFVGLYALDHTHQARRAERAALHQATMAEIDAEHEARMTRFHTEAEERDKRRHAEREAREERLRLVDQLRALDAKHPAPILLKIEMNRQ